MGGLALAVLLVAAVLLLRGGDEGGGARRGGDGDGATVSGAEGTFSYPEDVSGVAGEETVLRNDDDAPHTFTSDDGRFDSGTLEPGASFTIDTLPPGEYAYHCEIHPELVGTLAIAAP